MHGIFVDNDGFPLPLRFFGHTHGTDKGISLRHVGEMDVGRTGKGQRAVVVRLDLDHGNDCRGKRTKRLQILLGGQRRRIDM